MVNIPTIIWLYIIAEVVTLITGIVRVKKGLSFIPRDRLFIAPALIGAGVGALQMAIGGIQKIKANKMAKRNVQPLKKDDPFLDQQYAMAANMAGQGISDAAKQTYISANDRNLTTSLDAVLRGGGNMNNIGDLLDRNSSIINQLTLADEQARMRNAQLFFEYGTGAKTNENNEQFALNEYGPWKDRAAAISGLSQQGMNNIWKGINTGVGALMGEEGSETYETNGTSGGSSKSSSGYMGNGISYQDTILNKNSSANSITGSNLLNRYFNGN